MCCTEALEGLLLGDWRDGKVEGQGLGCEWGCVGCVVG